MSAADATNPAAPGRVVLVVDDEFAMRSMVRAALTLDENFTVHEASGAMEAREILEEHDFAIDAIVLDLLMPEVNGEELLEWVKAVAPQIAVVVLTGHRTDDTLIRCLAKGAADFLDKPCKVDELRATVERVISRQARIQERGGELEARYPAADWVELTAPSEIEYLGRMQRFSDVLFASRLPKQTCEDLRLAIEELGRNAIEWGNRFDRAKKFHVSYCIFDDRIVLKFEDEGEGFNPGVLPDPSKDPMAHIKRRKDEGKRPGGFGVFLMKNIMDEVVYNEKGNVCVMTKHIPRKDEADGDA